MTRRNVPPEQSPTWVERSPVVAPLVGATAAAVELVVAIVEGDWVAAAVFAVPAGILGAIARRNRIFLALDAAPAPREPAASVAPGECGD